MSLDLSPLRHSIDQISDTPANRPIVTSTPSNPRKPNNPGPVFMGVPRNLIGALTAINVPHNAAAVNNVAIDNIFQ